MPLPRLILIEGIPGSGKTTCAERLADDLRQRGVHARWHHEHAPEHPIIPKGAIPAIDAPEARIKQWQAFCEALGAAPEVVILEGSLFQRQTNPFVKAIREPEALAFARSIFLALRPVDCLLIYFTQRDVEAHFQWLEANRPGALKHFWELMERSPLAKLLNADPATSVSRYYERVQALTEILVGEFPGRVFRDSSAPTDWPIRHNKIIEATGLTGS